MKYRALRFAGRFFCRGGVGGATLRFRPLRRGRQRADVGCAWSGRTVVRPYMGGRAALFSVWGFFINLGGYLGYTYI